MGLVRRPNSSIKGVGLVLAFGIPLLFAVGATLGQNYKVINPDSQSLTNYLRQHQLPLVGAQVLQDRSGKRRVVLYGFVATEFGKNDAARKALAYVENEVKAGEPPGIENHIEVRPEIARMRTHAEPTAAADRTNQSLDQVLDDIERYGIRTAPTLPSR